MSEITEQGLAEHLARAAHGFDWNPRSCEPYIYHPQRVAGRMERSHLTLYNSGRIKSRLTVARLFDLRAIGWLHDTIEDTWVTREILDAMLPDAEDEIVVPVMLMTYEKGTSRDEYYVSLSGNERSLVGKFSDLKDNGDPVRLAKVSDPEDREKLTKKYDHAADVMGVRKEFEAWKTERRASPAWALLND